MAATVTTRLISMTRSSPLCGCGRILITMVFQSRMSCTCWLNLVLIRSHWIIRNQSEPTSTATSSGIALRLTMRGTRVWDVGHGMCSCSAHHNAQTPSLKRERTDSETTLQVGRRQGWFHYLCSQDSDSEHDLYQIVFIILRDFSLDRVVGYRLVCAVSFDAGISFNSPPQRDLQAIQK